MKILTKKEELCTGCGNCMEACSQVQFKVKDPDRSAIKVSKGNGGFLINVCNQCGECMSVCPVVALTRNKRGTVLVNKEICVGCYACVGFCPTLSMQRVAGSVPPFKCIACGNCVKVCEPKALAIEEVEDKV